MAPPKRTQIQIDRDRRDIAHLYLTGWTQAEIAASINNDEDRDYTLTQQMVSYDLKVLRGQWLESSLIDIDELKAKELARIDHLELEYWDGWERSKFDAEEEREAMVEDLGGMVVVERKRKGQAGDPRFLQGVGRCIDQRCAILGIEAPKKTDLTSGGKPIEIVAIGGLDPSEDL